MYIFIDVCMYVWRPKFMLTFHAVRALQPPRHVCGKFNLKKKIPPRYFGGGGGVACMYVCMYVGAPRECSRLCACAAVSPVRRCRRRRGSRRGGQGRRGGVRGVEAAGRGQRQGDAAGDPVVFVRQVLPAQVCSS